MNLPAVKPTTSVVVNLAVLVGGAVLAYIASNGLPEPVPPATSHLWQIWAQWVGGLGVAVIAGVNTYLHSVSADESGPLTK